eukprot:TRINITY_DN33857_c0_g1_i1.p3 TRINITY_DN33857_c0_g1~~TRINITY_DN33857_c0_g1_i1.p3  ORF type:complete len:102 (-),score=11.23 TRINITY_DN33857_c0_g1_i1:118-423(-)
MCIRDRYQRRVHGVPTRRNWRPWQEMMARGSWGTRMGLYCSICEQHITGDRNIQKKQRIVERFSYIQFQHKRDGQYLPMCCLLYTSPSPRDLSTSRMPSSA